MATKASAGKAAVHRTTVEVDLNAYDEARAALGTRGYKDTLNAALREVAGEPDLARFGDHHPPPFLQPEPRFRRTLVDIEIHVFEPSRAALGTRGYKDTVNKALRAIARRQALAEVAERIRQGRIPGPTPEELAEMRKPRTLF